MKRFNWNSEKNEILKQERGVSFDQIQFAIETGYLLDVKEHPNKKKYSNQFLFYVQIEDYVCVVPFVETEEEIFLKTIFPSRKATRQYLRGDK